MSCARAAHCGVVDTCVSCQFYCWREDGAQVDCVVQSQSGATAIELKSGRAPQAHCGTAAFAAAFKVRRTLPVGGDGIAGAEFLNNPVAEWLVR